MIALIALFPLLGATINGVWYAYAANRASRHGTGHGHGGHGGHSTVGASAGVAGGIAAAAIFASFVVSLLLFVKLNGMPEGARTIEQTIFNWMQVGSFSLPVAFRFDVLSSLFCLVITGVGTLIHLYSIGYMGHDEAPGKFFSYLNLFCFAMLVLVLGASMPLLFLGWEGVGLCSYLLIGFWYKDPEKASAGKKAFIVNRVGDLGVLLAMFITFWLFGTLDFEALRATINTGFELPPGVGPGVITAICLLLFVGCMGKSAQIPLYVWLPDAMAGPTPVSALIHAATMVTSGIYLVSRLNFMYSLSPTAMAVVAGVGAFTAFLAATIAIAQRDIKKVLAYSTVSQLGYMFLACGVGAYSAGVFHVITHAFFKALLFLGAGSVIHGMHEEQDIMKMGGLKKHMPQTYFVFGVAWLAICGIPPFSGFFSKDEVLWLAFGSSHGATWLWALGAITAVMTAFYMTRLFVLTFLGQPRFDEKKTHPHESPLIMIAPLGVLALLSFGGGFIGIPHASWLGHWLDPIIPHEHALRAGVAPSMEWVLMGMSVLGALMGIGLAFKLYLKAEGVKADPIREKFPGLYSMLENKWYVDELYEALFVRPIHALSQGLWKGFDVAVIDRIVVGFGKVSQAAGQAVRVVQTGSIQVYAFVLLVGVVATVGYLFYGIGGR